MNLHMICHKIVVSKKKKMNDATEESFIFIMSFTNHSVVIRASAVDAAPIAQSTLLW
jgi:hypothetical protein